MKGVRLANALIGVICENRNNPNRLLHLILSLPKHIRQLKEDIEARDKEIADLKREVDLLLSKLDDGKVLSFFADQPDQPDQPDQIFKVL